MAITGKRMPLYKGKTAPAKAQIQALATQGLNDNSAVILENRLKADFSYQFFFQGRQPSGSNLRKQFGGACQE